MSYGIISYWLAGWVSGWVSCCHAVISSVVPMFCCRPAIPISAGHCTSHIGCRVAGLLISTGP
ncbi:hypothetical protein CALCODRAFT_10676 [Calocera cornea HHB12733]|uniref:Uncharacterized protein n=1 Tax=Calocera cornea HHB12733 TaxID=1353952 RepID=A0A165J6M9_9BASI|nr:hypothetical protein CALCODRAFT_10676 [Calocera cornea HHB12733]